jgi:phenylacetate-CoA ligase
MVANRDPGKPSIQAVSKSACTCLPDNPVLSRQELQKTGQALLSNNIPKSHGPIFETSTTGATGLPVKVTNTSLVSQFWKALYLRDHQWHDRDLSQMIAAIRYADPNKAMPPDGQSAQVWGTPEHGIFKTGPAALLNIKSSTAEQSAWLCRQNPGYLMSYPTNILTLANSFITEKKSIPNLLQVRTVGEILGTEVRQACREAWDVQVVDMYSCQELGVIALQCPENEHYHVQSESLIVEVINDHGKPCAPGDTGRVVISTLHNFAMPLIRYELGDYAKVGVPCACGRGLPVLAQILGRQRNMLQMPNGEKFWPVLGFVKKLSRELPIQQAQFIQKSLDRITVRLVTERSLTKEEESLVISTVQEKFKHPFEINFSYLESIPRSKGGKYEDFMSEIT